MSSRPPKTAINDDDIWLIKPPHLAKAACYDPSIDPEIFFPISDRMPAVEEAKSICRTCPELMRCAEFGMSDLRIQGIWGGLTWTQRKDLHRQIKLQGGIK